MHGVVLLQTGWRRSGVGRQPCVKPFQVREQISVYITLAVVDCKANGDHECTIYQ